MSGRTPITEMMPVPLLRSCARCGEDHPGLTFFKFLRPVTGYEWWTPCPTTDEPILMRIVTEPKEKARFLTLEAGITIGKNSKPSIVMTFESEKDRDAALKQFREEASRA